jgi:hypothetical protein
LPALLLIVDVAACGDDDLLSADAIVVPEGHAAIELNALSSVDEVSAAAENSRIDFVCGTFPVSGVADGDEAWACMVSDGGVVAVIAFDPGDTVAHVLSGPAIDGEVAVPVDQVDVYGVEASPGLITLSVESGETVIGTVSFGA